jgi:hypothetical protein
MQGSGSELKELVQAFTSHGISDSGEYQIMDIAALRHQLFALSRK